MSNPLPSVDTFFDSEDLMSWLLLNPDIVEFDDAHQMGPFSDDIGLPVTTTGSNDSTCSSIDSHGNTAGDEYDNGLLMKVESSLGKRSSSSNLKSANKQAKQEPAQPSRGSKLGKKRQRESVDDIEARVNELKSENADLQAHLMNVTQRTTEVQKQRMAMEKLMVTKLAEIGDREDSDQSELAEVVKKYTDIYADYGKCRQREVSFHLNQLEKLLCPTKTTKMSLWALQQDKSFFQTSKSPMFSILSKELELTPEQTEKIQERRHKTTNLLGQLKESLSLIATLKTAIEKKHACYDSICGRVQDAATPKQTVLFLKWIATHAEDLAKHIPSFSRNVHHMPNVEFVDGVSGATTSSSSASVFPAASVAAEQSHSYNQQSGLDASN
eukprot:CAMPEP_0184968304 /NCGR_PEP_ID=MMETSP1098-20130426/1391_1 /TAXON_ID=89044 /ORGANISM="Spumella elongata, Strain CCAP 955/1" /LENGTH=383 /DNA_ID=CAMNT_0027489895 /DNA_START=42 /DNA_END=1193 /DNA_ORIENTATION=+